MLSDSMWCKAGQTTRRGACVDSEMGKGFLLLYSHDAKGTCCEPVVVEELVEDHSADSGKIAMFVGESAKWKATSLG